MERLSTRLFATIRLEVRSKPEKGTGQIDQGKEFTTQLLYASNCVSQKQGTFPLPKRATGMVELWLLSTARLCNHQRRHPYSCPS